MASSVKLITIESAKLQGVNGRLRKVPEELSRIATREFRTFGRGMVEELKREAPFVSGETANSIRFAVRNADTRNVRLEITAGNKNRPPVIINTILNGSRPHTITAKRPWLPTKHGLIPMLLFRRSAGNGAPSAPVGSRGAAGEWVMTKSVRHPGTKPNDFFNRALNTMQPTLDNMLTRIGKLVIETFQTKQ